MISVEASFDVTLTTYSGTSTQTRCGDRYQSPQQVSLFSQQHDRELTSVRVKGFFECRASRGTRKNPLLRARRARNNGRFGLSRTDVELVAKPVLLKHG
ncbi:hypothetical protein [Leptolyngbya sp. FACHB-16]|uniref:hypothetical protein n=1 Tax=Leptolyngbya sp. PL-A3 TaxID=2933911 RepID=UPI001689AABD